jgi:hypothetical protein
MHGGSSDEVAHLQQEELRVGAAELAAVRAELWVVVAKVLGRLESRMGRMHRRRLGLQQLDGMGVLSSFSIGAARLACWITRRRSVDPLRGHGGAPFGGLVALAPTQQVPTYRVDGRLLGGTGWQVAAVRVRISSLCLSCSRARAAWFALRGCAQDYCTVVQLRCQSQSVPLARLVKPWCSSKTITCDCRHKLKRRIPLTRCGPQH